jgi:hypothetical protein
MKVSDKQIRDSLKSVAEVPGKRPGTDFWEDFRARSRLVPQLAEGDAGEGSRTGGGAW